MTLIDIVAIAYSGLGGCHPRSPLSLPDFEPAAELCSEDSWEVMVLSDLT